MLSMKPESKEVDMAAGRRAVPPTDVPRASVRNCSRPKGASRGAACRRALAAAMCAVGAALLLAGTGVAQQGGVRVSVEVSGTIDPAAERWVATALDDARKQKAELVIVRLDTPGGLDSSMRAIVKDLLAAPMPVAVYVSPNGARAASAGLFIAQAADIAAMAPQTNIGSATPISMAAAVGTRSSAARSATTRPPTSARWPRATAATATSPSGWCATP
jgi:membrane-bound serine protease (ClpP class)